MTWINKIKKYKRLDKRERKVYNSKLLASKNIFLTCSLFGVGSLFVCFFFFFFFLFYFFFSTQPPKLILFKKKKNWTANPGKEKKKKNTNSQRQPGKSKRKKKVKRWSKVAAVGPLCVFNYNIAIELWVMETENSQKLFSVSITHNSMAIL